MSIRDRILARRDLDELRAARDITGLAAALNADAPMEFRPRYITARAVMAECAGGAAILDALTAIASSNSAVSWAMKFIGQEAGLNIGDPYTLGMVDQLVTAGALTAAQGDALKALAKQQPVLVTQEQVAQAMYHDDGTEK